MTAMRKHWDTWALVAIWLILQALVFWKYN